MSDFKRGWEFGVQLSQSKASNAARELGRLGGHATARKLPKQQRIDNARFAAMRRWEKVRTAKHQACQHEQSGENK